MNEVIKQMTERRSVRSYNDKPIAKEILEEIVLAGKYAANGMGKQAAKMVVVTNRELVEELSEMNKAILGCENDPFYGAKNVIIVFADAGAVRTAVEDGSLVMGNLMLAAHSLGVASCWIHRAKEMFETERGKELMKQWGIPDTCIGVGNCILGYSDAPLPEARPRKDDFAVYAE